MSDQSNTTRLRMEALTGYAAAQTPRPAKPAPTARQAKQGWTAKSAALFVGKKILLLAIVGLVGLAAGYFINKTCFRMIQVSGTSMVPTLSENSRHLVNLVNGRIGQVHRNDIVVFRDPGDHGLSVKRVIAGPGDAILIKDGEVFLNGERLEEDYLMSNIRTYTYSQKKEQMINLGVNQYFLLGDNRNVSIDSRSYGPVSREDIIGKVDLKNQVGI